MNTQNKSIGLVKWFYDEARNGDYGFINPLTQKSLLVYCLQTKFIKLLLKNK